MIKPDSLRNHLTDKFPTFNQNPETLLIFIDEGSIRATAVEGLSFEYSYILNIILTDYAGNPTLIMVALIEWLRVNQIELLNNPDNRDKFKFICDILNNNKIDLSIELPLTETVTATKDDKGDYQIVHHEEPEQIW